MMKNRYILYTLLLVLFLWSCQRSGSDAIEAEQVQIRLSVQTNSVDNILTVSSRSAVGSDPVYALKIYNSSGDLFKETGDCSLVNDIRLDEGAYKFVVYSGEDIDNATLDMPYYYGEKTVTVVAGVENQIDISAKQLNVKISADFAEIVKDDEVFSDYSFSIDEVKLTKELIDSGSALYKSSTTSEFKWSVSITNVQGVTSEISSTLYNIQSSSHYKFYFDVDLESGSEDGSLSFDLLVDSSLKVYNDTIDVSLEKQALPTFTATGFTIGQQQIIKEQSRDDVVMQLDMLVPSQTDEILLRHTSKYLCELGMPYSMKLSQVDDALKTKIANNVGVEWSSIVTGNVTPIIEFTNLARTAPLGTYKFYVTLTDKESQFVEATVEFSVLPEQDHLILSVEHGAKYAVFYGEWCTLDQPDDLSFEYKKTTDAEWTVVPTENVEIISTEDKTYQTRVTGLDASTKYEVRSYGNGFIFEDDAIWQYFTTDDAPEIPNLSFDDGYTSGDTWYPNASGGNSYWATGNEGVTYWLVGKDSNTVHTDDAVSGKAVRMFTYTGITVVDVAAGSLFTGTYSTNMTDPSASVVFGRAYTGRPLGLKGWYKYTPQYISSSEIDKCHIYICLEDWGTATSRPSNPTVIGYGELKSDQTTTTYQQFEIEIEYYSSATPTHVTLAATSSHKGGDFEGASNSELYIDEFELVWE